MLHVNGGFMFLNEFKKYFILGIAASLVAIVIWQMAKSPDEPIEPSNQTLYVGYNPKCFPQLKLPETQQKEAIEKWLENQTCPPDQPYVYSFSIEDAFLRVTRVDSNKQREVFVVPF